MSAFTGRLIHDEEGLNSGAWPVPAEVLITPTEHFFTRSHAPIPRIDAGSFAVSVDGLVEREMSFSLDDLAERFTETEVTATLICAGMRRAEFLTMGPLPGELPWGPEPASTGVWGGYKLCEILLAAGVRTDAAHVAFVGLDRVERRGETFGFGGSIDLKKAMSEEVILATRLNGQPLAPHHGYPLRAIVPGWIGARSVKWLDRITVLAEPSPNYFQSEAYRVQRSADPSNPRDVSAGQALSEVAVNAVILSPTQAAVVDAGRVHVRGWAVGSGGAKLQSVEVSVDGGASWRAARVSVPGTQWSWSLWEADVDLPPGEHMLAVRATDLSGSSQPDAIEATWNVKGYANNAWHRVTVHAK
jgi:sulfite oxidase